MKVLRISLAVLFGVGLVGLFVVFMAWLMGAHIYGKMPDWVYGVAIRSPPLALLAVSAYFIWLALTEPGHTYSSTRILGRMLNLLHQVIGWEREAILGTIGAIVAVAWWVIGYRSDARGRSA
jgi:hypothetical protein